MVGVLYNCYYVSAGSLFPFAGSHIPLLMIYGLVNFFMSWVIRLDMRVKSLKRKGSSGVSGGPCCLRYSIRLCSWLVARYVIEWCSNPRIWWSKIGANMVLVRVNWLEVLG